MIHGGGMSARFRPLLSLAAAACVLMSAAGCGGPSAAEGRASATIARNQVFSAMRVLYQHLLTARVGLGTGMGGFYAQCVTSNSKSELFYDGSIDPIYPVDRSVSKSAYQLRINNVARAQGWRFNRNRANVEFGNEFPYEMAKGSLGGHISVASIPPGSNRGHKLSGLIEITSSCFDAGPAASSLTQAH